MFKNNKAFTLIELIVVIAIIGVIAGISMVSYSTIRQKGRDTKRIKDIEQIQTALKLYFYNESSYPQTLNFGHSLIGSSSPTNYMGIIPQAPTPADGICSESENSYYYSANPSGSSYTLTFCLGHQIGQVSGGTNAATPTGIASTSALTPAQIRDNQRLADIHSIEAALNTMHSANGYYFNDTGGNPTYYLYSRGKFLSGGGEYSRNCSEVAELLSSAVPCPANSDWCIKLGANIGDMNQSSGANCDSGTVYMRNIPLNNYLPIGIPATGWFPYSIYVINDYNGSDDYLRVNYRLEGLSSPSSDHFVNGVPANCHYDSGVPPSSLACN